MSVRHGVSSFGWCRPGCADCMVVPLFCAERSPNPVVKTALLRAAGTESTSREGGANNPLQTFQRHLYLMCEIEQSVVFILVWIYF